MDKMYLTLMGTGLSRQVLGEEGCFGMDCLKAMY